jgi:hypothetical protein
LRHVFFGEGPSDDTRPQHATERERRDRAVEAIQGQSGRNQDKQINSQAGNG